jgi:hypothetical protein
MLADRALMMLQEERAWLVMEEQCGCGGGKEWVQRRD